MGSTEPLLKGVILRGRYEIKNVLGRGGMGRVYQAWDTEYRRSVAVKEMLQENLSPGKLSQAQRQFEKEASILQRLPRHAHIPEIFAFFSEGGRSYLVMQFIEGQNLLQLMRRYPGWQLPIDKVVRYALQLCDVLSFLHQQTPPIIFRDLKPENVMVSTGESIYLIDFGIARFFTPEKVADTQPFMSQGYAAPEAFWGTTEPRSDLYSLGATLHHCLTGFHPKDSPQPFYFHSAQSYNVQVPSSLDRFLLKLVSTQKQERYANAHEALQELQHIMTAASDTTVRTSVKRTEPVSNPFYDPKTGQALEMYMSLTKRNKLPGVTGRLFDKMAPFFTAVGIWYMHSFRPFLRRRVEWVGKSAVNSAKAVNQSIKQGQTGKRVSPPAQRAVPDNVPLNPPHPGQPVSVPFQQPLPDMKNRGSFAQVAALPQQLSQPAGQKRGGRLKRLKDVSSQQSSLSVRSSRSSGGIFASIAGADPVPYLGMLLTTIGTSVFLLAYVGISPLPVLLVLLCLLGLFALITGVAWKMVSVAQNLLGATLVCVLVAIVVLLATPGVQGVIGMFTFAQLLCVPIPLGLFLWFLSDHRNTRRLLRLPILLLIPIYLLLNQLVVSWTSPAIAESQVPFLTMHPFDLTNFNVTISSLLVLLGVEVFFSLVRFKDFLIAQVLASLALVFVCIVFTASWKISGPDALNAQVNSMQWMQWIVLVGAILLVLMIIICLPSREENEETHTKFPHQILRLVVKAMMLLSVIILMIYISLLEANQVKPPIGNNPMDQSNLELWQFGLVILFVLIVVSMLFNFWQVRYRPNAQSGGIKKAVLVFSTLDSVCLLAITVIVLYFWSDYLVQPSRPPASLPFHIPTDDTSFSILLISSFAVLSVVFWLWLQRPMERVKRGTLVFYNILGLVALGLAIVIRVVFWTHPTWFDWAMIIAVVFFAQSLLVVVRSERELARSM
jgi:serine/threonine protein kinase